VAGVFGFPEREDAPFLLGFAARTTPSEAVAAASAEAVQLLAFLWGEPLPDALSMASAPTAARHLDAFQVAGVHRLVRRWLEGGHARYAPSGSTRTLESSRGDALAFVDLTPPWLVGRFRVAKAVGGAELPLVFGESPWTEHLPSELRLHPVP
jgi:ribosomal protein S12 methylthiotransferase accessory factor YcaO